MCFLYQLGVFHGTIIISWKDGFLTSLNVGKINCMVTGFPILTSLGPWKVGYIGRWNACPFLEKANMEGPFFQKTRGQKTESSSARGKKTCHSRSRQRTKGETPRCVAVLSGKKWMAIFGGLFLRDMEEFHWFQYPTFVLTNGSRNSPEFWRSLLLQLLWVERWEEKKNR